MRSIILVLLTLSLGCQSHVYAKGEAEKLVKRTWYRVSTPHFSIYTDSSKRTAKRLAENLERFRTVFHSFTRVQPAPRMRKIKVVATRKKEVYNSLAGSKSKKKTAGFFVDSINGNYALVDLGSYNSLSILFHEYTHYLHANMRIENPPIWFAEGIAEYFSTMEFKDGTEIIYGKPHQGHLSYLRSAQWAPIERTLLANTSRSKIEKDVRQLYAQGWLMVHYFWSKQELAGKIEHYLELVASGVAVEDAVNQALGMSLKKLNSQLRAYANKSVHFYTKVSLSSQLETGELTIEKLTKDVSAFELGEFVSQARNLRELAEAFYDESLRKNASNANALAGLARIGYRKDIAASELLIARAKALEPENAWVATVSGHFNATKYLTAINPNEKTRYWNNAIGDYGLAIRKKPLNLDALYAVSRLYLVKGNSLEKYDQIIGAALDIAPSNNSVRRAAILANLMNERLDSAEFLANLIRANSHLSDEGLEQFDKWYEEQSEKYRNKRKLNID